MELQSWKETQNWKEAVRRALAVLAGLILLLLSLQFLLAAAPSVDGGIDPVVGTLILKLVLVRTLGVLGALLGSLVLFLGLAASNEVGMRRMRNGLVWTGKSLIIAYIPALLVVLVILYGSQSLNIVRYIASADSG